MADKVNWRVTSTPDRHDRDKIARRVIRTAGLFWIIVGIALAGLGAAGIGGAGAIVFGLIAIGLGIWQMFKPNRL